KGVDEWPCNRAAHIERETRLDRHAVGEPCTAWRNLLKQVVLGKCMDEWHGMRREIEREAAILLPAEEVLVNTEQRKPNRSGGSHAVRLVAGPDHLTHAGKPFGPGFSVFEDREHLGRPGLDFHSVLEAYGSRVEERCFDGVAGKGHGGLLTGARWRCCRGPARRSWP